mmetsp:Transcript_24803/g.69082  ORF Transcript_24803/g.69082 Transcript_24803/m.69082 type:complete len:199 (+) Transcript_24803:734-1330(+)
MEGVDAVFALHVWPWLESGKVASRAGPLLAGALDFTIAVHGHGGHAAMPHKVRDPVVAGSAIILALQTLVSRETAPLDSAVISTPVFRAGDAPNIIPNNITIGGTLRALKLEHMQHLKKRMQEVAVSQAAALGCTAQVEFFDFYPPTVNSKEVYNLSRAAYGRFVPGVLQRHSTLTDAPGRSVVSCLFKVLSFTAKPQ